MASWVTTEASCVLNVVSFPFCAGRSLVCCCKHFCQMNLKMKREKFALWDTPSDVQV